MKKVKTKNGGFSYRPSLRCLQRVIDGDNATGYCLGCGKSQGGVEPDAERYPCESCSEPRVYGAEQLVLLGLHS